MINILHITPHLGGGVGTVVLNWLIKEKEINKDFNHRIACLEINKNSMKEYLDLGISIHDGLYFNRPLLMEWINESDIVLMHWWNHPTLYDVIVNSDFPECRLILWNHVSALNPPYILSNRLIEYSDRFIFTSPVTYETEEIINLPDYLRERLGVVWSSCGTDIFTGFKRKNHKGFIVGLTGTVDYGKLHPDFIKMCANINIPDVHFIVCSGDPQDRIKEDAEKLNITDKFSFKGRVPSIIPYLAIYDVFGYPLQPKHLGSCEQAIGEAMMAGAVPVVLNNPAERYIIDNNVTGIIAVSQEEYCRAIEYLYHHPEERTRLAKNAVSAARKKYSISRKIKAWREIFDEILHHDKRHHTWSDGKYTTGSGIFIESLAKYGEIFKKYIRAKEQVDEENLRLSERDIFELFKSNSQWYSNNKGGVKQYLRIFPDDFYLKEWNKLLI
ncbi:MAG: glycosyltransferase family 4 protein [Desulfatiglans sp.]|jgi:glycosyltransferase involved in cell wall biosynthesis|nr:glycosyltransferase family 4 protein [Desulfatiglans sp.]